ncbi:MAG: hypothetical protein KAW89_02230 [Armatimonadetes bacterium]|nr:hypothetical protein [Armatimonadota bacterium]
MAINARILTPIELPDEVEIEIKDTVKGTTMVRTVDFHKCLKELGELGAVDLEEVEPAELITMACALAKHRAIDEYLVSIGVDPHAHLTNSELSSTD